MLQNNFLHAAANRTLTNNVYSLATLCIIVLLQAGCSDNGAATTTTPVSLFTPDQIEAQKSRLSTMMDEFSQDPTVVSGLLTINDGSASGSYSITRGMADPVLAIPMSEQHQFHIASMTKPFTSIVLLQLIEEGHFSLDSTLAEVLGTDALADIFPDHEFSSSNSEGTPVGSMSIDSLQRHQENPTGGEITIRMLTQHSHGMPDVTFDSPRFGTPSLAQLTILQQMEQLPSNVSLPEQWSGERILEYYLASDLPARAFFEPGSGYHYGDTGPVIAGLIIERTTGMSLAEAYRSRIFDPLSMHDTYLHHYEPTRQAQSTGISHRHFYLDDFVADAGNVNVESEQWNTSIDWAGGGLVSTAVDLDKFLRGLFEGELLQNTAQLSDSDTRIDADDEFQYYGLGIGIRTDTENSVIKVFDHGGFWGSYMAYYPDKKITAVFMANQVVFDEFDTLLDALDKEFY